MAQKNKRVGVCYLTGTGPGDPGLMTLKAMECVETADVLVCDHLIPKEILRRAKKGAEIIHAGKRKGEQRMEQSEINRLLVDQTRAGKRVVRLKGGDPLLFGRGGEEAIALAEAGLPFEIIPGVTSAFAVPASAGIPVTHRDYASQVTVFTGHEDPEKEGNPVDYHQLATLSGTRVMLMGAERISKVVETLIQNGLPVETPVALIRWGTTPDQQTIRGTAATIAKIAADMNFSSPSVAVFGEVVSLRDKMAWFEKRPLFGKRIVITRSREQGGTLGAELRALGADVIEIPAIQIEPPIELLEFGRLVQDSHGYDWIVFTSVNGVEAFFEMFYKIYDDAREIGGARIAAIGSATAQRIRDFHLKVDLQPPKAVAESLVQALQKDSTVENLKILVIRPEVAREVLAPELSRLGAIVDEAIAYRTVPASAQNETAIERFKALGADLIAFTSSSTVENFIALNLPMPVGIQAASIGPITSGTLRKCGWKVGIEAAEHDVPGLIRAICKWFGTEYPKA